MDEERWVCAHCGATVVGRSEYSNGRYSFAVAPAVNPALAAKDRFNVPCGCLSRIWPVVDVAA